MPAGENVPDPEAMQMILPAHIREDPRPGKSGGRFALITCMICGKEIRRPWSDLVGLDKRGKPLPKYCSKECYTVARGRGRAYE